MTKKKLTKRQQESLDDFGKKYAAYIKQYMVDRELTPLTRRERRARKK